MMIPNVYVNTTGVYSYMYDIHSYMNEQKYLKHMNICIHNKKS